MHVSNARQAVIVGVSVGSVCLVGVLIWWFMTQPRVVGSQLSERSQQFMAEHGADIAVEEVSFDQKEYVDNQTYDEFCYSFQMPFKSAQARIEDPAESCIVRLLTKDPISRVAIQAKTEPNPLTEDPAITMRRANTEQYRETSIQTARFGQALRFDGDGAVTVFWQSAGKTITIGFTGLTDPATVDIERLRQLIDSFQLVTTPSAVRTYVTPSTTTTATQSAF